QESRDGGAPALTEELVCVRQNVVDARPREQVLVFPPGCRTLAAPNGLPYDVPGAELQRLTNDKEHNLERRSGDPDTAGVADPRVEYDSLPRETKTLQSRLARRQAVVHVEVDESPGQRIDAEEILETHI